MDFIGQSAIDIRHKLQCLDGIRDMTLKDLVREADKVFHKRETEEEKEQSRKREREERKKRMRKRKERGPERPEEGPSFD